LVLPHILDEALVYKPHLPRHDRYYGSLERGAAGPERPPSPYEGVQESPTSGRFKSSPNPLLYIATYLYFVFLEGNRRGYRFDPGKIVAYDPGVKRLPVREGQLRYEMDQLLRKLAKRCRAKMRELAGIKVIEPHPLFSMVIYRYHPFTRRIFEKVAPGLSDSMELIVTSMHSGIHIDALCHMARRTRDRSS
jgi:hypothetical protein